MSPKKCIDLRKDLRATLYYRRNPFSEDFLEERLPFASKEKELKSKRGFQLELNWPGDLCLGFLRYWGSADAVFFLERLELFVSCPSKRFLIIHKSMNCPNFFQILDNSPHFIYLEQAVLEKAAEGSREQSQILLLPAGIGPQKLDFRIEHKRDSKMRSKIKSLIFVWNFQNQRFQSQNRTSLTPIKICAQRRVRELDKEQNTSSLKDAAFFWESEVKKLAHELNLKSKSNSRLRRSLVFSLAPEPFSEARIETKSKAKDFSIKKLKNLLNKIDPQKGRYELCCLDLGAALRLGNEMSLCAKFALDKVSREIRAYKLQLGLDFAPLVAAKQDPILAKNPELFLQKDAFAFPYFTDPQTNESLYVFDLTHPEYSKYLSKSIHRIINKWKFNYLHLTGLEAVYLGCSGNGQSKTGTERLRSLLKTIRQAAGKKVILSAEQDFLWPGLGILNTAQANKQSKLRPSSRDSDKKLEAELQFCLESIGRQACLQHRFFLMGTGDLLAILYRSKLTQKQKRLLFSIIGLFGGQFFISSQLVERGICTEADFIKMLELHRKCDGQSPVPLGIGASLGGGAQSKHKTGYRRYPIGMYHRAGFLGLWNPKRKLELVEFFPIPNTTFSASTRMRDYWTGQYIPWRWQTDKIQIALGPFESFVAEIF